VKADRYLKNGVKEYWIANPEDKTIQVWINHTSTSLGAGNAVWEKHVSEVIKSQLLAGFELNSELIFEE
jgi:Uma2 family endonuclease